MTNPVRGESTPRSLGLRNRVRTGPDTPMVLSLKPVLKCPPPAGPQRVYGRDDRPATIQGGQGFKLRSPEGREGDKKGQKEEAWRPCICRTLSETVHMERRGCLLFFSSLNSQRRGKCCFSSLLSLSRPAPLSAPLWGCVLPCRTPHFMASFTPPRRFNE